MKLSVEQWSNYTDRGKQKYWGKNCPTATLPPTDLTKTDLRSKPGLRHDRPVTDGLNHGRALCSVNWTVNSLRTEQQTLSVSVIKTG